VRTAFEYAFEYVSSQEAAMAWAGITLSGDKPDEVIGARRLAPAPFNVLVMGHSHEPGIRSVDTTVDGRPDGRHVVYVNTGSWAMNATANEKDREITFATLVIRPQGATDIRVLKMNDDENTFSVISEISVPASQVNADRLLPAPNDQEYVPSN